LRQFAIGNEPRPPLLKFRHLFDDAIKDWFRSIVLNDKANDTVATHCTKCSRVFLHLAPGVDQDARVRGAVVVTTGAGGAVTGAEVAGGDVTGAEGADGAGAAEADALFDPDDAGATPEEAVEAAAPGAVPTAFVAPGDAAAGAAPATGTAAGSTAAPATVEVGSPTIPAAPATLSSTVGGVDDPVC